MVVPADPVHPSLHIPCAGAVKLGQISNGNQLCQFILTYIAT